MLMFMRVLQTCQAQSAPLRALRCNPQSADSPPPRRVEERIDHVVALRVRAKAGRCAPPRWRAVARSRKLLTPRVARAYVVKDGRGPPPSRAKITAMAAAIAAPRVGSSAALSCAHQRERALRWAELMRRVLSIDVLLCGECGVRMEPIADITDKRVARRILDHVGFPSHAPQP
jgi:hypothetical protein